MAAVAASPAAALPAPAAQNLQGFDVEKAVADFVADASQTSLQLPHMTTGQRKHAKRVVEKYTELTCESFGFGQERQLHLFKKAAAPDAPKQQLPHLLERVPELSAKAGCAVSVKNTFIDDWQPMEQEKEAPVMRSMPPQLHKNSLQNALKEEGGVMYVSSVKQDQKPTAGVSSPAPSTAAPSCSPSASPNSPAVSELEARPNLVSPFSLAAAIPGPTATLPPPAAAAAAAIAPPPGLSVRNTFIHVDAQEASDERVVQSMPHDMFRKCLLEEVLQSLNSRKVPSAAGPYDAAAAAFSTCMSSVQSTASHSATSTPPQPPMAAPLPAHAGYPLLGVAHTAAAVPQQAPQLATPAPTMAVPEAASLMPGSEVVIEGLSKMPAFNGLLGTVESFDTETGRYTIQLVAPTATGHKTAKLKAENLRPVAFNAAGPPFAPEAALPQEPFQHMMQMPPLAGEPCLSTFGAPAAPLMATPAPRCVVMPDAGDRAALPQALRLTALV
eukprot:TRINITY_DN6202_c0_g1_i1.p1 TRINITY_DN6202_c0_g1~~TRINITY_DN6202_c0_g1_i1.p1  ORF type:complete len:499 (-),score=139.30 TRINITY_DN6202_c0_g1_i1:192-1688(-)